MNSIGAWLMTGFVFAVLLAFWLWLGEVFDVVSDWQAAQRRSVERQIHHDLWIQDQIDTAARSREDAQATKQSDGT